MKLSSRFALDVLFVLAGAFLTVAATSFTAAVAGWVAFGVFTGVALLASSSLVRARTASWRVGHGLIALVSAWALVAALVPSGALLAWLVFADAIAVGVLALADLTAHELTSESVIHRLEVTDTRAGHLAA
ncbi:MAG TPA: hypothetical protein VH641_17475 [Streptosporangiaceae bacterium]|jgi:uncharacterized membrane protein HdeD (DUF308 family)